MTPQDGRSKEGWPARIFAGLGFFYALGVTAFLLLVEDRFEDEPNADTVLAWVMLPLLASFASFLAVMSGFAPLRAWVWVAVIATLFFCWIAAFSIGPLYLPVPVLLLIAVLCPWRRPSGE